MIQDGPEEHDVPFPRAPEPKTSLSQQFGKIIFYMTWGITLVFLIASIVLTVNPMWATELSSGINPFFFILLILVPLPGAQVLPVLIVMFALYLIFFTYMIYRSNASKEKQVIDTPVGYYVAFSSAFLLIVTLITLIEGAFNTPLGGGGLEQGFQQQPFQTYFSVIYAPFAEEIGFRIIPLGLLSFYFVMRRSHNLKDSLISIAVPGHIRKKYNMKFTAYDWAFVIITSAVFGYAHIFFGAWDIGKFIPTFVTGIALAIGFLKFGLYVDIPMHWFFNGFLSIYVLQQSLLLVSGMALLWIWGVGVFSISLILLYISKYLNSRKSPVIST